MTAVPAGWVSLLVELNDVAAIGGEGGVEKVVEEYGAIDRVHGATKARHSTAHLLVHGVQRVCHRVHGVDHEA